MTGDRRDSPGSTLRSSSNASDVAVSWKVKCLNCGAALAGPFCAECGQRAIPPHPTVRELAGDAVAEFAGWDGKFAETVKLLLRTPGELTQAWIGGRRVHFISPLRLYLTTSFLYFLVTAGAPNLRPTGADIDLGPIQGGISQKPNKVAKGVGIAIDTKKPLEGPARDSLLKTIETAPALLRPMFRRIIVDPTGFTADIRAMIPRVFFVLVPAFALVLALFFRGRHYPEHLYFAIHFFAFFFVARGLGNLTLYTHSLVFSGIAQALMIIWIAVYAFIAIRRVYGGSAVVTVAKGVGVLVVYAMLALPVLVAAILIAVR